MELIWSALVFIATFGTVLVGHSAVTYRLNSASRRLQGIAETRNPGQTPAPGSSHPQEDRMPTISGILRGRRFTENLCLHIAAAGLRIRPSEFIGIVAASIIFFEALAVMFIHSLAGVVVFSIIGALLPMAYLSYHQWKRRAAFNGQIVGALMMISSSLRSGFSLLRAMQVVAQEMPAPISEEFNRIINEISIGRPMDDALKSIVARTKSYDFDLVVTAMMIQMQVGGNLAEILDTIASTIRERVRIMDEMRALTAEGRISGTLLFALPIFLGIALSFLNPKYMSVLTQEPVGHYLIGFAIALQIVGGMIIMRMLRLDV